MNHTELQVRPLHLAAGPNCIADPVEIADSIDRAAALIGADPLYAVWATSRLGLMLGLKVAVSSGTTAVEVIEDLGGGFAGAVRGALDDATPGEVVEVLRAAQAVIESVVQEVRRRGLAG